MRLVFKEKKLCVACGVGGRSEFHFNQLHFLILLADFTPGIILSEYLTFTQTGALRCKPARGAEAGGVLVSSTCRHISEEAYGLTSVFGSMCWENYGVILP